MKTDRELLELAAKAAGIVYEGRYAEPMGVQFAGLLLNIGNANRPAEFWSPLTDNGDALWLAVQLNLLNDPRFLHERDVLMFTKNMPKLEATRRAIVRAAAAIGEILE